MTMMITMMMVTPRGFGNISPENDADEDGDDDAYQTHPEANRRKSRGE